MEKELLNKDQFTPVEVPEFLKNRIQEKIHQQETKLRLQTRLLIAAATITLLVNIGFVSQYKAETQPQNDTELNPFSTLNSISYE